MKKLFAMAAIAVMCLTGCNKANTAEEALDFVKRLSTSRRLLPKQS